MAIPVPAQYAPWFVEAGNRYGIPPATLAGVAWVESRFGANKGPSSAGAVGLMQFLPSTAAGLNPPFNPNDDRQSIFGAAEYLAELKGQTGSLSAALDFYSGHSSGYVAAVNSAAGQVTGLGAIASAVANFIFPVGPGYTITQRYQPGGHPGVDLADPIGTPFYAAAGGTIVSVGSDPSGFGPNGIVERLADGTELTYGHGSAAYVHAGQTVTPGQLIGAVGTLGLSSGPHLHFQVNLPNGQTTDPLAWLSGNNAADPSGGTAATQADALGSIVDVPKLVAGFFFIAVKGAFVITGGLLVVVGMASTARKPTNLPIPL